MEKYGKDFFIKDFNNFIRNIKYDKSTISYATNTIMIDFKNRTCNRIYSFWLDPAWRIVFSNKIIINSFNYPYHENYTKLEQKKEEDDFGKWCSKTDFMKHVKIKNIHILESCDLIIEWENGAVLDKFVNDMEDDDYVFYDHIEGKKYRFSYGNIKQVDLEISD